MGKVTLEDLFSQIQAGEMKNLNVIVKADVQGSAEAVKASLEKLSNEEVRVRVIHCAVGAINESDVMLATTSGAIIVGFNVRPDANAKESAARSQVDMRMYRVIYDAINEIEAAMKGMLAPKFKEVDLGRAEVRNVFRITGVGMVAGCYVLDGKMQRGAQMRLLRDNIVIYDGAIASLQRFKDSVKEVAPATSAASPLRSSRTSRRATSWRPISWSRSRCDAARVPRTARARLLARKIAAAGGDLRRANSFRPSILKVKGAPADGTFRGEVRHHL